MFRRNPPSHAVIAIVPHTDGRRVLLIRHAERGGIELPAGGVEPDEHPVDAVDRELREETRMRAVAVQYLTTKTSPRGNRADVYVVAATGIPFPGDDAAEAFWGDPRLLLEGSHPEDYAIVANALRDRV